MKKTITIGLMLILMFSCTQSNNRNESLVTENENLKVKVDSLRKLLSTKNEMDTMITAPINTETEKNYWFIPTYDGKKLIRSGINNPEQYIENALREKPDLIPLKAVLGGTMRIGNIQVLSDKWLIADYNDGHIEGKAIYRYQLNKKGELDFQLLETTTNSQ